MSQRPRPGGEPRGFPRDSQRTGCIECPRGATCERTSRGWGEGRIWGPDTGTRRESGGPAREESHPDRPRNAPSAAALLPRPSVPCKETESRRGTTPAGPAHRRGDARCHLPPPIAPVTLGGKAQRSPRCSLLVFTTENVKQQRSGLLNVLWSSAIINPTCARYASTRTHATSRPAASFLTWAPENRARLELGRFRPECTSARMRRLRAEHPEDIRERTQPEPSAAPVGTVPLAVAANTSTNINSPLVP